MSVSRGIVAVIFRRECEDLWDNGRDEGAAINGKIDKDSIGVAFNDSVFEFELEEGRGEDKCLVGITKLFFIIFYLFHNTLGKKRRSNILDSQSWNR